MSIGIGIPASIALYDLPPDIVVVAGPCPVDYFVWGDDIVLVDSCTRRSAVLFWRANLFNFRGPLRDGMRNVIPFVLIMLLTGGLGPVEATEQIVTRLPSGALAVGEYFYQGQSIHDRDGNEICDVNDVLIDKDGRVAAVMVGVGGVLGAGEKNVAIAFEALELAKKGPKPYLVLDLPLAALELAPGFEFDRAKRRWVPAAARLIEP